MKRVMVVLSVVSALMSAAQANSLLWDQGSNLSTTGVVAQDFTDFPTFSSYEFDDFVVSAPGWFIKQIIVYGDEFGNPNLNVSVNLSIQQNASFTSPGTVYLTATGTQIGDDLVFNLPNVQLNPGTYWITAWVERPFGGGGGQWFWLRNNTLNGSEHYFHNPGGGFGYGTNPIPGQNIFGSPSDLAFRIYGQLVPEPVSLIALGSGLASLLALRRRRA